MVSYLNVFIHCLASSRDNVVILAECIDMMFFKRRKQIPSARLLAFIKRLSVVSLQVDPTSSAIIMDILRKLLSVRFDLMQIINIYDMIF